MLTMVSWTALSTKVQKHIHGFRGDGKMVTIGGNNAGSFSTEAYLNTVPELGVKWLFNRAIM